MVGGISGRLMTFIEKTNSEAEKSIEDNEVRQITAKLERKKGHLVYCIYRKYNK